MIERKIEMQKDDIIKNVDENIVSLYMNMGWKQVEQPKKVKSEEVTKKSIKGL